MKQYFTRLSLLAAVVAAFAVLSGCKDTIPDPGYVDFAQIRIMNFIKCTPLKIEMIPDGTKDTTRLTPTALTFSVSTPYINNLPTARGAGQKYLFNAVDQNGVVIASMTVVLKPGDKISWMIYDRNNARDIDWVVSDDNPTATTNNPAKAYFRFINSMPGNGLYLRVGDALKGEPSTPLMPFRGVSDYLGIDTLTDTTVTFFVVDDGGNVFARLAGVSLEAGSYHTLTYNGYGPGEERCRKLDNISNQLTPDDSLRIHILDDNTAGNDQLPVPLTLRFNIINALLPPSPGSALTNPYADGGGVSFVVNNNTSYDFKNVMLYQGVPTYSPYDSNAVQMVYPKSIPYTGAYIKVVKATGDKPSGNDPILMKFFANTSVIQSDQLVSIVVFDSVLKPNTKAAPYDSSAGVVTFVVPDAPISGKAVVLIGGASYQPFKTAGTPQWTLSRVNGIEPDKTFTKIKKEKLSELDTVTAGANVTYKGSIKVGTITVDLPDLNFTPDPGGIYEVLVVGKVHDPNGHDPRFIVIRTNPIK